MEADVLIRLETSHHAAFRVGGWAFVRRAGAALAGQAGGARRASAERTALAAVVAALAPPEARSAGAVRIETASADVAAIPGRLAAAQAGEDPPQENLELWAQVARALEGGRVAIVRADPAAQPTAFAAAWAEHARDRAKDKGDFAVAIPKPNLAKSGAT